MAGVKWTPDSLHDLDKIFDFVGEQNQRPKTAEKMIRSIVAQCDISAEQPLMAAARSDLGDSVRSFPVGPYVVIYRPAPAGIIVLRVIHGSRDIPTILRRTFEET